MAPLGESLYFPPLDKCFNGEFQLLSWKTTFNGLSQLDINENKPLRQHLTDPRTLELLTQVFAPCPVSTPQTKSSFETKTSAINITPSAHGQYDIKQTQDDSLWLADEAGIDELSALRIVVLEWQTRPATQLLQSDVDDEIVAFERTIGSNALDASLPSLHSSILSGPRPPEEGLASHFGSSEARRLRLLRIYFSERRYILKTCEYIIFNALCEIDFQSENDASCTGRKGKSVMRSDWVEKIGRSILEAWNVHGVSRESGRNCIIDAVDALQSRLDAMERGSECFKDEGYREDVENAWARNQIVEIIHIMQTILILLESSVKLTRSDVILSWFRFMSGYCFFEKLELLNESIRSTYSLPLQSLVALNSLAVLNISSALDKLSEVSTAGASAAESGDNAPYLLNPAGVTEINEILLAAAAGFLTNSSPAVLAWAIILQTLREYASFSKETRELRQSQRAADTFGVGDSSDSESIGRPPTRNATSPLQRPSTGSDTSQQSSFLEEMLERVMHTTLDEDPIGYLARSAVDGSHVFDILINISTKYCTPFGSDHDGKSGLKMRIVLLDLIRAVLERVDYLPQSILASLAVLTGNERHWDVLDRPAEFRDAEPAAIFLNDEFLMQKMFENALSRFPYESLPFLKLCRALAVYRAVPNEETPTLLSILRNIDSLTCVLPHNFVAYEIIQEDEDNNIIQLTDSLNFLDHVVKLHLGSMKTSKQAALALSPYNGNENSWELSKGTVGRVLSESRPLVVRWKYEYSGLTYLGKIMQHALTKDDSLLDGMGAMSSRETVTEIVGLITTMLLSSLEYTSLSQPSVEAQDRARAILEEASDGLSRNQDIISVIFEIFEDELHRRQIVSEDGSLDLLVQCIQFTHALLPIVPGRVWPFLGRSSLLGIDGGESRLKAIIASTEMVLGRYDFLLGCVHVLDALVEDAVTHSISRRVPAQATTRFTKSNSSGAGISDTALKKVLLNLTRTMVDVFESTMNWKFTIQEERLEINTQVCSIFQKIISYSFEVDDSPTNAQKLIAHLAPTADYLVDVFLSRSTGDLTINPIVHIFLEGVTTPNTTLSTRGLKYWTAQVRAVINLSTELVRVSKYLQYPPARLEEQLFKAAPVLAKVYAAHESYRLPVISLFESLIRCAGASDQQPPSLLGHLGQKTARNFLEVLSTLGKPIVEEHLLIGIWRLLSAAVSKRQQWFAIFILTGNTPRESFKDKKTISTNLKRAEPLFTLALDALSDIERLQPKQALAMLEFVGLAADFWPWIMTNVEKHPTFLNAMTGFVAQLGSSSSTEMSRLLRTDYDKIQMTSFIADILAMYNHHIQQSGNTSYAKKLLPSLKFFTQHGVAVPTYNASLHGNLRKNFESKFSSCSLTNLKRTAVERPLLGDSFYFHLEIADKMLRFDSTWAGNPGQDFNEEFRRANVNLSVVESQVALLQSWKFLANELSLVLAPDSDFQKTMARVVIDCLRSNVENSLPDTIFNRLAQSRADLAFTLLQRLIEVHALHAEVKSILPIAWNAARSQCATLESGLLSDSAEYYRTLIKILYLALQAHVSNSTSQLSEQSRPSETESQSETNQIVLEVIRVVVAQGFRSLTATLHDDPSRQLSADFALITAILRTALRIPSIDRNTSQLLSLFSDNSTARYASTLLSWSDQLTMDHDPIYGELSILFLLEMSTIPALAESLAVEGILARISNTNLISYFRRGRGIGPFDNPRRMYSIWSRGILPLFLNLLDAIGAPMAAEMASALNDFPNQLSRAGSTFDSKRRPSPEDVTAGCITLSVGSEAQSLSILATILDTCRKAGASAGVVATEIAELAWDRNRVREDVQKWMSRRTALRDRIVPMNEREEAWAHQTPLHAGSGAESRLEEKVVEELNAVLMILNNDSEA